jgi:hypothetical protein
MQKHESFAGGVRMIERLDVAPRRSGIVAEPSSWNAPIVILECGERHIRGRRVECCPLPVFLGQGVILANGQAEPQERLRDAAGVGNHRCIFPFQMTAGAPGWQRPTAVFVHPPMQMVSIVDHPVGRFDENVQESLIPCPLVGFQRGAGQITPGPRVDRSALAV